MSLPAFSGLVRMDKPKMVFLLFSSVFISVRSRVIADSFLSQHGNDESHATCCKKTPLDAACEFDGHYEVVWQKMPSVT